MLYFGTSFAMLAGTPIAGALYGHGNWTRPIVFSGVCCPTSIGSSGIYLHCSRLQFLLEGAVMLWHDNYTYAPAAKPLIKCEQAGEICILTQCSTSRLPP